MYWFIYLFIADTYSIPHGIFMFLGYSETDENLLKTHNNQTVLDAVDSLDHFVREKSSNNQVINYLFLYLGIIFFFHFVSTRKSRFIDFFFYKFWIFIFVIEIPNSKIFYSCNRKNFELCQWIRKRGKNKILKRRNKKNFKKVFTAKFWYLVLRKKKS